MTYPAQLVRGEHGKEVGKTACAEGATDWVMIEDFDFKKLANADEVAGHFDVCLGCRLEFLPSNIRQCDLILVGHHYLHSARLMGEQLRYAVIRKGQWLAVAAWSPQRFAHRDGGLQRLQALIFAEAPRSWHLPV